jgi:hypothetical protein
MLPRYDATRWDKNTPFMYFTVSHGVLTSKFKDACLAFFEHKMPLLDGVGGGCWGASGRAGRRPSHPN